MSEDVSPAVTTRMSIGIREVRAVFDDQVKFDAALDQLRLHGFDRADLSVPVPTPSASGATPEGGAANPDTDVDRQQARTIAGSTAGVVAAMAGAAVTAATGGVALAVAGAAVGAGALVGGATHALTAGGTGVEQRTRDARADEGALVLVVSARDDQHARIAEETLRAAGAVRVEPVDRTDASLPRDA